MLDTIIETLSDQASNHLCSIKDALSAPLSAIGSNELSLSLAYVLTTVVHHVNVKDTSHLRR